MCGKKSGYGYYAQSTETQAEYVAKIGYRRVRKMLATGGSTRFMPKYPPMQYRPEGSLYGLQGLSMPNS